MNASIIVTTYKRVNLLERAILSCLNQDYKSSFEVIVVDDNGKGTEAQILTQKMLNKYPQIVYLALEENSGACVARNVGANLATGDYIMFLDDDDELLPNKISVHMSFHQQYHNYEGSLVGVIRIEDATKKKIESINNYPNVKNLKQYILEGNFYNLFLCIRRESFLKIGGFDDLVRFQDRYFMIKALYNNIRFAELKGEASVLYEHLGIRITNSTPQRTIDSLLKIRSRIKEYNIKLTNEEWLTVLKNEYRQIANIYYLSETYSSRLKAIPYFFKIYRITKSKKILLSIIKTLIKP